MLLNFLRQTANVAEKAIGRIASTGYGRGFSSIRRLYKGTPGINAEGNPITKRIYNSPFENMRATSTIGKGIEGMGALAGTMHGTMLSSAQAVGGGVAKGAGWLGEKAWKNKFAIGSIATMGYAGLSIMNAQYSDRGNPMNLNTYNIGGAMSRMGIGGDRGNNPFFLRSQMQAIQDQAIYEQSPMGGMGSRMTFTSTNFASPIPGMAAFQRNAGYSPGALNATGSLVGALHSLRRQ